MAVLLSFAVLLGRRVQAQSQFRVEHAPQLFALFLIIFFVAAFIPGLRKGPEEFIGLVNKAFTFATGKTPYAFFKDRASFSNKLSQGIKNKKEIIFSDLDVTFAWDAVCIFGPYTDNQKAKSVLQMNWDIEERSKIRDSDSINALVFLYQGQVNQVVDLSRGLADFKDVDMCLARHKATFNILIDANGRTILDIKK